MQARPDELLRRLENHESLIRTLQTTQVSLNEDVQETGRWTTETPQPQQQPDDDAWWYGSDQWNGRGWSQSWNNWSSASWSNTKPTNNPTTVPTWNGDAKLFGDFKFDVLMYNRGSNPGDHCFRVPRLIAGLTGRAREHLRMAGDLDRFAVDGGLEKFLEYPKTKLGICRAQEEGMAFKKYIYEIKRARGESMTSWMNRSDEALMDMRKKLTTAPGANSSEPTMIPPQIQGWLLLHKARFRDQDMVGVMTMTGGCLNVKLVEKALLDLFTLMAKILGILESSTIFEAERTMTIHILMMTSVKNDDPYVDEDGNFLATEEIVSDIDDDLAIDDEEYHEALPGYREARDFLKEARVARGVCPVVVSFRADKPASRGTSDSSSVRNLSGKTGRGKGGRVLKSSGQSSDSRGRGKKGKGRGRSGARDGTSSSQVCFKCVSTDHWARDCPKMDDGSSNPKKRLLGAYAYGACPDSHHDNFRIRKCRKFSSNAANLVDSNGVDFLCGAAISPVQDDDECEAHAAFLVESEGFGVLDCGATTSFGSVEGAEALFSKGHEHDTRIPDVDPFGGRSFNLRDGASCKATLSKLPVRNEALGELCIPVYLFSDQPKPTPLMLGSCHLISPVRM